MTTRESPGRAAAAAVRVSVVAAAALGLAGCAHAPPPATAGLAWLSEPVATASTLALWHFDETTGLTCVDAGPAGCNGVLGIDTRTAFGRFKNAREFTVSINSFALIPAARAPRLGATWTIEAWINPSRYGAVEASVIAARWTDQPNEQGWMLGLSGFDRGAVSGAPPRPDLFDAVLTRRDHGLLVFAFQPQDAGITQGFESTTTIDLDRWTHIAVTDDGHELRMFIDGRLDAQFVSGARVRDVAAPLAIGNQIDARWLTESQGPLRVPSDAAQFPFYAFEGVIDELRISDAALEQGGAR